MKRYITLILVSVIILSISSMTIYLIYRYSPELLYLREDKDGDDDKDDDDDDGDDDNDDDDNGIIKPLVYIYVNSSIYNKISSEISQYRQDVINQGYNVMIINWSINNVTLLKQNITNARSLQQNNNLVGAVLIGKLPYANLKYTNTDDSVEIFPCDLYLMDLDGDWVDNNPNDNWFDEYNAGTGDIEPEIWVGRINPESLNNINHTKAYQKYFNRNHAYRDGTLTRPHSTLLYVDDDWSGYWGNQWYNDILHAYSNITLVESPSWTNDTNYEWQLTQLYEFIYLAAHSNFLAHYFGPGGFGGEGITNYTEILNIDTKALFYNFYACSAARFNETNNLGTQYLFSNNTLAVVGSTKTGGMWENSFFYTPLSQGEVMGEAFRKFFINCYAGPKDDYNVGLVLLGDPLLTI